MHKCAAVPCTKTVEDDLLMCLRHWRMVPKDIQRRIWQHYRRGQSAATSSAEYNAAYDDAVNAVRTIEGRRPVPRSNG